MLKVLPETEDRIVGLKFVAWDKETRSFQITPKPGEIDVVEFDYRVENRRV